MILKATHFPLKKFLHSYYLLNAFSTIITAEDEVYIILLLYFMRSSIYAEFFDANKECLQEFEFLAYLGKITSIHSS